ncbi:MAG: TerC family protein [Proteobacteria bacterium]|nr:TerC family protein [Pseudomonadota bacterium]
MDSLLALAADPTAWAALVTLVVMEVVLGVDNLVFVSIISNKLAPEYRSRARRIGLGLALVMRLGLLSVIAFIVSLTAPIVSIPWTPPPGPDGHPPFDLNFSWRDLILIAGGLFLIWKATREIHENVDPAHDEALHVGRRTVEGLGTAIVQILLLDIIFSIDSILTAVGMTEHLPIMMIAVVIAVGLMLLASDPLAEFIRRNPTVVMLALGFLLMIGATLIADGFGVHVPKGYIYAAMAFAGGIEALNGLARRRSRPADAPVEQDSQE